MKTKAIVKILGILGVVAIVCVVALNRCKSSKGILSAEDEVVVNPIGPIFNVDSAYAYCAAQCAFGPRIMNSEAHERCAEWLIAKFRSFGCDVKTQKADLKGYDGTILKSTNIMASYRPEATTRILLCAHWDSRPWADNDPDKANWHTPVMAANDGASGIAVLLEIARLLTTFHEDSLSTQQLTPNTQDLGIDFVCFDAEDWGVPQWSDVQAEDSWALGAQYFAAHLPEGYEARYGILLDMVGGQGAKFYQEGMSNRYAPAIVKKVWRAARQAGYGSYFPNQEGGYITDDHIPLNEIARIPTIDIIPFYKDCAQSSFGPTWHTINDTMENIDRNTLKAVGQTIIQVLFTEMED